MNLYLPTLENVPMYMAFNTAAGAVCGVIAGTSPVLWAQIFVIGELAGHVFYLCMTGPTSTMRERVVINAYTSALVKAMEIFYLRKWALIGTPGTLILGGLAAWHVIVLMKATL